MTLMSVPGRAKLRKPNKTRRGSRLQDNTLEASLSARVEIQAPAASDGFRCPACFQKGGGKQWQAKAGVLTNIPALGGFGL